MTTAVMLIGIALMIVIHEGGHFIAAKAFNLKATEAFFGFGPTLWSTQKGETKYGIKAIPLGGYVKILGMNPFEEIPEEDEARTYRAAPFWQKAVVVLAGIASHMIMAFLLFLVVFTVWGRFATNPDGLPIPTLTLAIIAETTPDGDPAPSHLSGFEPGDLLTSFEGTPVDSWNGFVDRVQANGGNTVMIGYEREGTATAVPVTLAIVDRPVIVDDEVFTDEDGNVVTEPLGYFGAAPERERVDAGLIGNITGAIGAVGRAVVDSFKGLWQLIVGFPELIGAVFGGNDEILNDPTSPRPITLIGLARIAGPLEATLGLLALVNVFVGIVNVIPLYPLDGGHFAVALYEKVTGKEPDVRKLTPVAAVVVMFLITLGLIGLYLDLFKPLQL